MAVGTFFPEEFMSVSCELMMRQIYTPVIADLLANKEYGKFAAIKAQQKRELIEKIKLNPNMDDARLAQNIKDDDDKIIGNNTAWLPWIEVEKKYIEGIFGKPNHITAGKPDDESIGKLKDKTADQLLFITVQFHAIIEKYKNNLNQEIEQYQTTPSTSGLSVIEDKNIIAERHRINLQAKLDAILVNPDYDEARDNDILTKYEKDLIAFLKSDQVDMPDKIDDFAKQNNIVLDEEGAGTEEEIKSKKIARLKRHAMLERLRIISLEYHQQNIKTRHDKSIMTQGRIQAAGFAASAAATMVGGTVLTVMEAVANVENDAWAAAAISGSVLVGIPVFAIVTIMNWYIAKNLVAKLLEELFSKEEWLHCKTWGELAQKLLSLNLSLVATALSALFTAYATYIFFYELTLEIFGEGIAELGFEFFCFLGGITGLFTLVTYLAVMHYYGKRFSWAQLANDFTHVGNLALISRISWSKVYFYKTIPLALIAAALMYFQGVLNPIALALFALIALYSIFTAYNRFGNTENRRLQAQMQMFLFIAISLIAAFFIMFAAAPTLIPILGLIGTIIISIAAWLGVCSFYTMSSTDSFIKWLTGDVQFLKANADIPLKQLRSKAEKSDGTASPTTPAINSCFEPFRWVNAVANATPGTFGVFELKDELLEAGLTSLDTTSALALATTVLIGGTLASYAGNASGMPADITFDADMDRQNEVLSLINNIRSYFNGIESAINLIDDYMANRNTITSNEYTHVPYWGKSKTEKFKACENLKLLLIDIKDGNTPGTISEHDRNILNQGYLKTIWQKIEPLLKMASNDPKQLKQELSALILELKAYMSERKDLGNHIRTSWFAEGSLDRQYFAGSFSKEQKGTVADKLRVKLELVEEFLENVSKSSSEIKDKRLPNPNDLIFTPEEKAILLSGKLGKLYARAEIFLRVRYLLPSEAHTNKNNMTIVV